MRKLLITPLSIMTLSFAQQPFQSLEGAVGYIVVERGGKVENYVVIEGKDGSVKTLKVDKSPAQFMKKTEEPREGGRK